MPGRAVAIDAIEHVDELLEESGGRLSVAATASTLGVAASTEAVVTCGVHVADGPQMTNSRAQWGSATGC